MVTSWSDYCDQQNQSSPRNKIKRIFQYLPSSSCFLNKIHIKNRADRVRNGGYSPAGSAKKEVWDFLKQSLVEALKISIYSIFYLIFVLRINNNIIIIARMDMLHCCNEFLNRKLVGRRTNSIQEMLYSHVCLLWSSSSFIFSLTSIRRLNMRRRTIEGRKYFERKRLLTIEPKIILEILKRNLKMKLPFFKIYARKNFQFLKFRKTNRDYILIYF